MRNLIGVPSKRVFGLTATDPADDAVGFKGVDEVVDIGVWATRIGQSSRAINPTGFLERIMCLSLSRSADHGGRSEAMVLPKEGSVKLHWGGRLLDDVMTVTVTVLDNETTP